MTVSRPLPPSAHRDQIDGQAARWAARLGGGPLTGAEQADLNHWLTAHPGHAGALAEARDVWRRMDMLCHAPGPLAADLARLRRRKIRQQAMAPWRIPMAVAASLLLLMTLGWQILAACGWSPERLLADHQTGIAQQADVVLADGSRLRLGPSSAVRVDFDDQARRLHLLSGVLDITARPRDAAESRPLVVEVQGTDIRALGTRFIVNSLPHAVDVTVIQHQVEISHGDGIGRVVLSEGQGGRYHDGQVDPAIPRDPDLSTLWQRGQLIFDHMALEDVVAQINRYRPVPVIIAGSTLARRTVSGIFDTGNPDAALATIANVLDARIVTPLPWVSVLYAAGAPN